MKLVTLGTTLFIVTIFLFGLSLVNPLIVRRHLHDGILYDDFAADADSVRYTITGGQGWNNLNTLAHENLLREKTMFCTRGPGAWLLYPESDYKLGSSHHVKIIYHEHCVPADDVNSLQPLGPIYYNAAETSSALTFTEKCFQSLGVPAQDAAKPIKSLVVLGNSNWTVDNGQGKKICLSSSTSNDGDLCVVEDVESALGVSGDQVTIVKGCQEADMEDYALQTCYGEGYKEFVCDFDFSLSDMKGLCSSSDELGEAEAEGNALKHKFLNVLRVWERRMDTNSDYGDPVGIPNAQERFAVLSHMMYIVDNNCPNVDSNYLDILKHIYLIHIKNGRIWNNTDASLFEQNQNKWIRAQAFVMECAAFEDVVETSGCGPEDVSAMNGDEEVAAIEDFLRGEDFDFVIEQIWLILNFVGPFCNDALDFKDNYWSIFPLLFKRDFLVPLREQWKNPGRWATYYPLMFNGFDMDKERKELISCVQAIIMKTPFLDPLARPSGFLLPKNTDIEGLIAATGTKPTSPPSPPPAEAATAIEPKAPPTNPGEHEEGFEKRRKRQRYFESQSDEGEILLSKLYETRPLPHASSVQIMSASTVKPDMKPTRKSQDASKLLGKKKGKKGHKKRKHAGKRNMNNSSKATS